MKITDFNVAIVERDSHLSKWIQEQRRLNVQEEYLSQFEQYIPNGGTVIDVGACIGDHTITYARMVGKHGWVHAFEPNLEAFECLEYNTKHLPQVRCYKYALGSRAVWGTIQMNPDQPNNLGAARVVEDNSRNEIVIVPLDSVKLQLTRLDFIKIDAEGMEPDIIRGAFGVIYTYKPVVLMEINKYALARKGFNSNDAIQPLREWGYVVNPSESHHNMDMEQLDVLAVHGGL